MDSVRSGPFGQIFRPDNFIFGQVSPCFLQPLPHTILLSDLCFPSDTGQEGSHSVWKGISSSAQLQCTGVQLSSSVLQYNC